METIKEIDFAGRIVIPADMRRLLKIKTNDQLHIATDGDRLIIEKKQDTCALCGGTEALIKTGEKYICEQCHRKLFKSILFDITHEERKCLY